MENIPKYIMKSLCVFKSLEDSKTSEAIIRLILLLWREFYISVRVKPKIEFFTVTIKRKNEVLFNNDVITIGRIKNILKNLISENTISGKDIDRQEDDN